MLFLVLETIGGLVPRQDAPAAGDTAFVMPTFDKDPGPLVNASIWTMTAVGTVFLAARVYFKTIHTANMWWDDYLLIAGWAFLLANSAIISELMRVGFGMTLDFIPRNHTLSTTADMLNKIALGLSKTSFAVTLLRVAQGWQKWFIWTLVISMNALFLVNCVTTWKPACGRPGDTYQISLPEPCWSVELMSLMAMICNEYSALVDFCLALLPWKIIWTFQMRRHEKIGVAVAMSLGLAAGVIGVIKVIQITTIAAGPDIPYRLSMVFIWGQAEPNATIIAASIPVLRVLFRDIHRSKYGNSSEGVGKRGPTSGSGGGFLRSNNESKFHRNGTTAGHRLSGSEQNEDDGDSERSILGQETSRGLKDGDNDIVKTTEVVIDYDRGHRGTSVGESFEMTDRSGDKRGSAFGRAV
ncbi:hypothetical protein B0T11DRAFT_328790 [Plectosphaerella cucumerina]|uniref:Rhodopsin domain-containing protein n=1 Tax=Plectosphaerella cucumerina TaxID=40658 RepID=A0A8K0TIJ3_9PEZI|nr:hypothetical protein B0T11DRAFT_328790 [Plectosphaerella cucumerina]